jgi:pimeloyl-ACP methyl ester carboxylesterase
MENKILYKNKNIFYRVTGTGKPVVLLHGFGEDGNIWNDLAAELEKKFLLIIPDIPGSGKSEMLEGENISMDDYAEAIKEILLKVSPTGGDLEGASMIGHSMGGYITLAFAEKYGEQLNAFGLFHSTAFTDTKEKIETRLKGIEFIKKNGSAEFLKTSIPGLFAERFKKDHPEEVAGLIEAGKEFKSASLIQYHTAMINRPDRSRVLKTFNKPVLFIIGEKDSAIPLQSSLQQSHLPSISYVHILPNSAHMGMMEEKMFCNQTVLSFLTSCC